MGTTLHARVEVRLAAVPEFGVPAHWQLLSEWWFQKDYELQLALSEHPERHEGWPSDVDAQKDDLYRERRLWLRGEDALGLELLDSSSVVLLSLLASLRTLGPLRQLDHVRVLFWHR
jgi:hypothetical protein